MSHQGLFQNSNVYNFLDPKLSPKIKSDAPCMDGYEANNLISSNSMLKARGFLAYSHIKPPIELEFELICPVDIHHITLHTVLGSQRATGISLSGSNDGKTFLDLAQGSFTEDGIIFCNSKYYSKYNLPPNSYKFCVRFFKNNYRHIFGNCNKIIVKIFRTDRTVPCLAKAEIWGSVARLCPEVTFDTINHLMHKNHKENETKIEEAVSIDEFTIPEEYVDSITCELMTLPMTLPSGHNIDQTTLEKCINNDSAYGRQPCDPFTGLKFTDTRKPVFNVALKTRIDMYLVKNSNKTELFNVKRTLGRKRTLTNTETLSNISSTKKIKCNNDNKQCMNEIILKNNNEISSTMTLDDAIKTAINSENFLRFTLDAKDTNNSIKKVCSMCNSDENIYNVPCEHLFCRLCLLKICETLKCNICDKKFLKAQVKRFHI